MKHVLAMCMWIVLAAGVAGVSGCGDEAKVGVSGVVLNADTFAAVENACVYLYGSEDLISEPTDANGAYTLEVPEGSRFILAVDDCTLDGAEGDLYATINADFIHTPTIDTAITGWPIHVSPSPELSPTGGIAAYEAFFEGGNDRDLFAPVTGLFNDTNKGWIYLSTFYMNVDADGFFTSWDDDLGQTFVLDQNEACPVGYVDWDGLVDGDGLVSTEAPNAPNILLPGGGTETVNSAVALSFCNDQLVGDSVTMTHDPDYEGQTAFTYEDIPIVPNTCTLIFPVAVNGEFGKSIKDGLIAFGIL